MCVWVEWVCGGGGGEEVCVWEGGERVRVFFVFGGFDFVYLFFRLFVFW